MRRLPGVSNKPTTEDRYTAFVLEVQVTGFGLSRRKRTIEVERQIVAKNGERFAVVGGREIRIQEDGAKPYYTVRK
jgi:hypothetical protein